MRPKKKHFKKIVEFIKNKEDNISPVLLDQIVRVGIELELPDTLGQLVRDLIIQDDVSMNKITYMKFLMFLERCKGFEDDAKKFLMLVTQ